MTHYGQTADIILFNGDFITMDDTNPSIEALAISDGSIAAVGSEANVFALIEDQTIIIDLEGYTVLPGFVDAHNHLFNEGGSDEATLIESQQLMLQNGITTFGNLFSDAPVVAGLQAFEASGQLKVKTSLYLTAVNNCGEVLGDWYKAHRPTRNFGEKLRIGGVKIFTDGGTCGKLPAVSFVMPGSGNQGDLFFTQEELDNLVLEIDGEGYQLAVHAQGDVAIRQAITSLAKVTGATNPKQHRIEHNPFVPDDLVSSYSEHSIVPVVFGDYVTCQIDGLANFFGAENLLWLEDWRTMIDANPGLPIAWHSDAPILPISPIRNLFSYVTRQQVAEDGSRCMPPDWLLEHSITVEEALQFMTTGAAYALDRESEVGSLTEGKLADLVVLSGNPLTVDPNDLIDLEVLGTMVEGEFLYCHPDFTRFCESTSSAHNIHRNEFQIRVAPNPFPVQTNILFKLPSVDQVTLRIMDAGHQVISTLIDEQLPSGHHMESWRPDAEALPGLYFYDLIIGKRRFVGKLLYL